MELADMGDLSPPAFGHVGSTPTIRTKYAPVAKLADALWFRSQSFGVKVRLLPGVPNFDCEIL